MRGCCMKKKGEIAREEEKDVNNTKYASYKQLHIEA